MNANPLQTGKTGSDGERQRPPGGEGRRALLGVPLALLALLLAPANATASDARRHGLAGNLAFEDDTDLHAFPQLAREYGDRAVLDVTEDGQSFRGGLIMGWSTTFGLFVNRPVSPAWFSALNDAEAFSRRVRHFPELSPPAGMSLEDPRPLLDAVLAFPGGFGAKLSVANTMDSRMREFVRPAEEAGADPTTEQLEEGAQATAVTLAAGWSTRGVSRTLDLAGHLTFNRYKTVVEGKVRGESSLTPSVLLLARGGLRSSSTLRWVGIGRLAYRNYDMDMPYHSTSVEAGRLLLELGAGPRVALGDGVELAALLWLGMDRQTYALGKNAEAGETLAGLNGPLIDEATASSTLFPGLDLGLEVTVTKWLLFRAGWTSRYRFLGGEASPSDGSDAPLGDLAGPGEQLQTELSSAWAAGARVRFGQFVADGSFQPALLTSGPELVGGRAPGTFAWISLSYSWAKPAPRRRPRPGAPRTSTPRRARPAPPPPEASPYIPPAGSIY